jgi:hypothetical protein
MIFLILHKLFILFSFSLKWNKCTPFSEFIYFFIYLNGSVLRIYLHLLVHLKEFTDKL